MYVSRLMRRKALGRHQQSTADEWRALGQLRAAAGDERPVTTRVPVSAIMFDTQPLRRHPAGSRDPLGGSTVPAGVADVLRRRRGQGAPLPESTRTRMAEQFQLDLAPVRIHNDAESHDVAAAVQSVAFTHGNDIYFSRGSYRPDSPAGERLLAHELAHVATPEPAGAGRTTIGRADDPAEAAADATADRVVAQLRRSYRPPAAGAAGRLPEGGATTGPQHADRSPAGRGPAGNRDGGAVRRLAVANTDWTAAIRATHSSGGGVGVMIVRDGGSPVVVKAGEDFMDEAVVAAKILTAATAEADDGWAASAPSARPVGAAEAKQIKMTLMALLPADQQQTARTQVFLDNLENNSGVMVYGFAAGQEIKASLVDEKQSKSKGLGRRSLRKDSVSYQLMNDPGLMRTFGRASAADILLGNGDRFVGKVNLENVMVDATNRSVSFIDNVEANDKSVLRLMASVGMTGKRGFDSWTDHPRVASFAKGDFGRIAAAAIGLLGDTIQLQPIRKEDKPAIRTAFAKKTPQMEKWFAAGLASGHKAVLDALTDPITITAAVPDDTREEVITSLLARRFFLSGMPAAQAWTAAAVQAKKLMARLPMTMPPLPALPGAAGRRPVMPPLPGIPNAGPGRPAAAAPQRPGRPAGLAAARR